MIRQTDNWMIFVSRLQEQSGRGPVEQTPADQRHKRPGSAVRVGRRQRRGRRNGPGLGRFPADGF